MDDRDFWNEEFQRDPEEVMVPDQLLVELVSDLEPGQALDLGCGSGRNSLMLALMGWSELGVDFAPHAVQLANEESKN
jgi:ribosomal protein L11 methylase PrmA